ncbi:hypothetical protein PMZ80_004755 [Knufia obscura]|uniref:AMP-dependent synthetase/ligase domain-containing protein n=1 Tax=Knufia obscura TaxID=1635080 RepID=A0ABR0RT33_9EURO|nr:hypothetical protein PMZ80_004755 [Knufia obscura]
MDLTGLDKHPVKLELLPHLLDRVAQEQPQKAWAVRPKVSSDPSQGFEEITYAAAANAVNRAAWFFEEALGKAQPETFPLVSYMGTADLAYFLLPIALVKCGYQVLLLSDLTSVDMREYLLKAADCNFYACTASSSDDPVATRLGMKPIIVPALATLLATEPVQPYPYDRTVEQGLNDPLMQLHTSGTSSITGRAKLVTYALGAICTAQLEPPIRDLNGYKNMGIKTGELTRVYNAFRISHAGGVMITYRFMYQGIAAVIGGDNPMSLDTIQQALHHANIDSGLFPPIMLEAMAKQPGFLPQLSKLKQLLYAGGPISESAGNEISKHTHLYSRYGSTENSIPVAHATDPEDWQYCHFNPEYSHFEFRPHPPDNPSTNLFEAVMVRHPDPVIRRGQPVFWNFPDKTEWPMEDLFAPHPTKPNQWKYIGRRDDMIIVGSGINVMPTFFEQEVLQRDPRVKKAVMYGSGEPHLAVLIELATPVGGEEDMARVKEELWPLVESCNQRMSRGTQSADACGCDCEEGQAVAERWEGGRGEEDGTSVV